MILITLLPNNTLRMTLGRDIMKFTQPRSTNVRTLYHERYACAVLTTFEPALNHTGHSYFKKKEALNSNVSGRLWCLEVTLFFCGKKGSNFKALF